MENTVKTFFEAAMNSAVEEINQLPQSGSARENYYIASKEGQYIVTYNEKIKENESFIYLSNIFTSLNLNTPKIWAVSDDQTMYIQDYLGKETLMDVIVKNKKEDELVENLVKKSLKNLYQLQTSTAGKIDFDKSLEYPSYGEFAITNDLFYFKSFIVDVLELPYHKNTLIKEFREIIKSIEELSPKGIMLRDFQSRNIMVNDGNKDVSFIDYQSAMQGPLMYDVVSFLYQAKAQFTDDFRNKMLAYYYSLWDNPQDVKNLENSLQPLQLIRFLQVLGAYGFRGLIQRKHHFISSIALGIQNITTLSKSWDDMKKYPELQQLIEALGSEDSKNKIENIIIN